MTLDIPTPNAKHDAALDVWVSKLNRMAVDIDAAAASMHPSAWHEALAPDFERFRKLAAGGPMSKPEQLSFLEY